MQAQLGDLMDQVHGDTDSERYAALIAKFTADHDGDVGAGLAAAANWLADNVPMYSLNCLVGGESVGAALSRPAGAARGATPDRSEHWRGTAHAVDRAHRPHR